MERLVKQAPGIRQLRKGEQSFVRTPGNLASYRMRERAETDYRNAFKNAKARAEAQGMAQGMAQVARRMLTMNFTPEQISQATELSLDEVDALRRG